MITLLHSSLGNRVRQPCLKKRRKGKGADMGGVWELRSLGINQIWWTEGSNLGGRRQVGNVGWDKDMEGLEHQCKKVGLCPESWGSANG